MCYATLWLNQQQLHYASSFTPELQQKQRDSKTHLGGSKHVFQHCHAYVVLLNAQGLTTLMLISQLTEHLWWTCGSQICLQALWSLQFSVPFPCSSAAMTDKGHHQDGGIKATTGWHCFWGFCSAAKERAVVRSTCGKLLRRNSLLWERQAYEISGLHVV